MQRSGPRLDAEENAAVDEPGEKPYDEVTGATRNPCMKRHSFYAPIMRRKQLEVRHVAAAEPPHAHRPGEAIALEVEPAMRLRPAPLFQPANRLAAIAEDA